MADLQYGHLSAVPASMAQASTMIQETILPGIVTQIFNDNPVQDRMWKNKQDATSMDQQIRVMKSQYYGGQLWDDTDTAALAQQYTRDMVTFYLRKFRLPIYVSDADAKMIAKGGDPSKSELLDNLLADAKATVSDLLGFLFYIGCSQSYWNPKYGSVFGGTGSIAGALAKGPDGLCAMAPYYDQTSDTTSRTFANVPVVASGASAANTWWQPQCIYNSTPPPVSLGIIYRMISIQKRRGRANPSLVVMPGKPWDALADIIGAYQATTFKDKQNPGFNSFDLRGVTVIADPHCPSADTIDQPTNIALGAAGVENPLVLPTANQHLIFSLDEEIGIEMRVDPWDSLHFYPFESTKITTIWAWLGWISLAWQYTTRKRAANAVTMVTAS